MGISLMLKVITCLGLGSRFYLRGLKPVSGTFCKIM